MVLINELNKIKEEFKFYIRKLENKEQYKGIKENISKPDFSKSIGQIKEKISQFLTSDFSEFIGQIEELKKFYDNSDKINQKLNIASYLLELIERIRQKEPYDLGKITSLLV